MAKDIVIIPASGQIEFSGSSTHHNVLTVDSKSISITTDNFIIDGGDITAKNYIVSSSVTHMTQSFSTGNTAFGDHSTDTHIFTGSLESSGSGDLFKLYGRNSQGLGGGAPYRNYMSIKSTGSLSTSEAFALTINNHALLYATSTNNNAPSSLYLMPGMATAGGYEAIVLPAVGKLSWGDAGNTYLEIDSGTPESLVIAADDDIVLRPDNDLTIQHSTTTYAKFDGDNRALDITGDISASGNYSGSISSKITIGSSLFTSKVASVSDSNVYIDYTATGLKFNINSGDQFVFNNAYEEVDLLYYDHNEDVIFQIDTSAGRVGIGALGGPPGETLDVVGGARFTGNITASGNISASGDLITDNTFLNNGSSLKFANGTSNEVRIRGQAGSLLFMSSSYTGLTISPSQGHITASGNISASGAIIADTIKATEGIDVNIIGMSTDNRIDFKPSNTVSVRLTDSLVSLNKNTDVNGNLNVSSGYISGSSVRGVKFYIPVPIFSRIGVANQYLERSTAGGTGTDSSGFATADTASLSYAKAIDGADFIATDSCSVTGFRAVGRSTLAETIQTTLWKGSFVNASNSGIALSQIAEYEQVMAANTTYIFSSSLAPTSNHQLVENDFVMVTVKKTTTAGTTYVYINGNLEIQTT